MKRIRPLHHRETESAYPSIPDLDPALAPEAARRSRRSFLQGAAAAGAALATGWLAPEAAAGSRGRRVHRVTLPHSKRYVFRYGNYELQRAVAQTRNVGLARFLDSKSERAGIERAMWAELNRHSCADLLDGKKLARLHQAVAKALARHYRKRTRRSATPPTVVLYVGVPGTNCDGDCPAVVPICKPPTP